MQNKAKTNTKCITALCIAVTLCAALVCADYCSDTRPVLPEAAVNYTEISNGAYMTQAPDESDFSIDDYIEYTELIEDNSEKENEPVKESGVADLSDEKRITAETFSDYKIAEDKASGAVIEYDEIIEMPVTGLVAGSESAGKKNLSRIESVMDDIRSMNGTERYSRTLFHVTIPEGVYYINCRYSKKKNRCIHLYSNTWLTMKGVTLIKSDTVQQALIRGGRNGVSVSGTAGEHNIIVEGGTIDINTAKFNNSHSHFTGVRFGHAHNIIFANVHFKGSVAGHHLELCGVENVSVVGCEFSDYKDTGHVKGINRNEALQIDITHNATVAPTFKNYDDTESRNIVVYGNSFHDLSRGVGTHSAVYGKYYNDIAIENNTFENIYSHAIYGQNYVNCTVSGNTIKRCGAGIELNTVGHAPDGNYYAPNSGSVPYDDVKKCDANITVSNNDISILPEDSLHLSHGISIHGGASSTYKKNIVMSNIIVESNVIHSATGSGIHLNNVNDFDVSENRIETVTSTEESGGVGISLSKVKAGQICDNTIKNCDNVGISISSSGGASDNSLDLYNNRVSMIAGGKSGVKIADTKSVDIMQNTIESNGSAIALISDSNVTVGDEGEDNSLTSNNYKYAVDVKGKHSENITVQYNIATATKGTVPKRPEVKDSNNLFVDSDSDDDAWNSSGMAVINLDRDSSEAVSAEAVAPEWDFEFDDEDES